MYVISNLGTMGANVVKIGMTRRLEPMDRVKELGDASVPFGFDVHALFFSDDAREIERSLHERFADQRVNKVNLRREFFYVDPEQVRAAIEEMGAIEVTFEPLQVAAEFRQSWGDSLPSTTELFGDTQS